MTQHLTDRELRAMRAQEAAARHAKEAQTCLHIAEHVSDSAYWLRAAVFEQREVAHYAREARMFRDLGE